MRSTPRPTRTDDDVGGGGLEQLRSSSLFSGKNCRSAGAAGNAAGAGSRYRYGCAATIAVGSPTIIRSRAGDEFSLDEDDDDSDVDDDSPTAPRPALAAAAADVAAGGAG